MKVLVLVGSRREGSVNAQLAHAAARMLPENVAVSWFPELEELPHYEIAVDTDDAPDVVARFRAAVTEADALLVVTPQFNGAMPSALKNAFDWASRPFGVGAITGKPVALLGASPSPRGPLWAIENAERVLAVAGGRALPRTFALPRATLAFADGELVDAEVAAAVRDVVKQITDDALVAA